MLCSLARPIRPYRTFLFVASQIGREEVRVATRWLPEQSSGDSHKPGVYASLRRLPPHLGSLRRSCPRLVLCQSELSFGMLISLRLPVSHRGLQPHKLMPMTGVHKRFQPSWRRRFLTWQVNRANRLNLVVRVARCRSKVFGKRERAVAEMVNGRLPGGEAGVGVWSRRVTCTAQTSH